MADNPPSGDMTRTILAGERTLLAWIRTGLALMGFGFVVARFGLLVHELGVQRPQAPSTSVELSTIIGVALVFLGVAVNVLSGWQHYRFLRQTLQANPESPKPAYGSVFLSLTLGVLGISLMLYLLGVGL